MEFVCSIQSSVFYKHRNFLKMYTKKFPLYSYGSIILQLEQFKRTMWRGLHILTVTGRLIIIIKYCADGISLGTSHYLPTKTGYTTTSHKHLVLFHQRFALQLLHKGLLAGICRWALQLYNSVNSTATYLQNDQLVIPIPSLSQHSN